MKNVMKLLAVFSLVLCLSCASLQKRNSNSQSEIVNILIERAERSRDSIYIIDWISNTESKEYNYKKNRIVAIKNDTKSFDNFKNILTEQGVRYEQELSYFKKQLQEPIPIDKSRINSKKVRFFPPNTDPEKLFLDKNFKPINYYYDLPKIVFTKDGNNALFYQKNREYENHITLYKKIDGRWKGIIDFIDKPHGIE